MQENCVPARMLYGCDSTEAVCTDAGHNSTFCLLPTAYFSHKTATYNHKTNLGKLTLVITAISDRTFN